MAFNPVQLKTSDKWLLQAWTRLQSRIKKLDASLSDAGLQDVFYVSKDGNPATAVPNSLVNKYLTIQAAVTAASAIPGAVVFVGPGLFNESVVIPDGTVDLSIVGQSPLFTAIQGVAGSPAIAFAPTVDVRTLSLSDLLLLAGAGAPAALSVDGSAIAGGLFQNGLFRLRNIELISPDTNPAASFTDCDGINFDDARFDSTVSNGSTYTVTLYECHGQIRNSDVGLALVRFDPAQPTPASNDNTMQLENCQGSLAVSNRAHLRLVGGTYDGRPVFGPFPPVYALSLAADDDATYVGRVEADGTAFTYQVDLNANYAVVAPPPTSAQTVINNCSFEDDVVVNSSGGVAHGPRLRGCTFAGNITATNGVELDIRGSQYEQGNLFVTGNGAIDRDTVRLVNCGLQPVLGPVQPAPVISTLGGAPFPNYVGSSYGVLVEPHTLGAPVTWNIDSINPGGKTAIGFNAEGSIGGVPNLVEADIVLVRR